MISVKPPSFAKSKTDFPACVLAFLFALCFRSNFYNNTFKMSKTIFQNECYTW